MIRNLFFAILILPFLSSCKSSFTYKDSPSAAYNFISVCISETLKLDSELNNNDRHYLVDFSMVPQIHPTGVYKFLKSNTLAREANLDSLFRDDKLWRDSKYFEHPVIRMERIQSLPDGNLLVVLSKQRSSDGSIGTEIILHCNGDQFTVIKSRITWIS